MTLSKTQRKLMLAPAVTALALSGLVASPAFATDKAADPAPASPSTEKSAPKTKSQEAAPTAPAPAALAPVADEKSISQTDLQEKGLPVSIKPTTGDPAGKKVTTKFVDSKEGQFEGTSFTLDSEGKYSGTIKANGKLAPGAATIELFIEGQEGAAGTIGLTVVEDAPAAPKASVDPKSLPQNAFEDGNTFNVDVSGFDADEEVTVTIDGKKLSFDKSFENGEGVIYVTAEDGAPTSVGTHEVVVTGATSGKTATTSYEITEAVEAGSIKTNRTEFTAGDKTWGGGIDVTGEGWEPNTEVTVQIGIGNGQSGSSIASANVKTDENGNFTLKNFTPEEAPRLLEDDERMSLVAGANGVYAESVELTVVEKKVEPSITATPEKISASDFENEDKGVTIEATGYQEGETVKATVNHEDGKTEEFTLNATADEEGNVSFKLYAIGDAVLGNYTVELNGDETDGSLSTGFEVVADDNGDDEGNGGGDGDNNADDNDDQLPRTGAELGGLGAGVVLLAVGAASVLLTRRRSTKSSTDAGEI
ncbi:hypothetical protein LWF01_18180 [Saxibacter everestensis]|uniref:LPXTG-motif cell wall anchor domain-containing protein n=1 Tax=Saxibacter everestensis TaxID=2909229 RepID=A0ABY8QSU8_9MICO|nr:hypothetical protein LWF01_18180 [Brevibacteriaceae bacterium ZFBP1038]